LKRYPVIVSNQAKQSLKEIVGYIKEDSPQAAQYVKNELISLMRSLGSAPEKYSKEFLLEDKRKNYRSVTQWRYKIIYQFTSKKVLILDIIHTSMDPEEILRVGGK
jgi:plasmid stabilization system protein ParE